MVTEFSALMVLTQVEREHMRGGTCFQRVCFASVEPQRSCVVVLWRWVYELVSLIILLLARRGLANRPARDVLR